MDAEQLHQVPDQVTQVELHQLCVQVRVVQQQLQRIQDGISGLEQLDETQEKMAAFVGMGYQRQQQLLQQVADMQQQITGLRDRIDALDRNDYLERQYQAWQRHQEWYQEWMQRQAQEHQNVMQVLDAHTQMLVRVQRHLLGPPPPPPGPVPPNAPPCLQPNEPLLAAVTPPPWPPAQAAWEYQVSGRVRGVPSYHGARP